MLIPTISIFGDADSLVRARRPTYICWIAYASCSLLTKKDILYSALSQGKSASSLQDNRSIT